MITMEDAKKFSEKIDAATGRVARDYATGDVTYEEPFSDQLCGRLKESLEDFETPNFRWQAEVADGSIGTGKLRARSLKKIDEEPLYGADIVMAIDIQAADYSVRKGFLIQAKRLEPGKQLTSDRREKLLHQCQRMLALTPSSMVFLYHLGGVHAVPATAVVAARGKDLWGIATWPYRVVFMDFAMCWFGDQRLQSTDPVSLEGLRMLVDAPFGLRIVGEGKERKID